MPALNSATSEVKQKWRLNKFMITPVMNQFPARRGKNGTSQVMETILATPKGSVDSKTNSNEINYTDIISHRLFGLSY